MCILMTANPPDGHRPLNSCSLPLIASFAQPKILNMNKFVDQCIWSYKIVTRVDVVLQAVVVVSREDESWKDVSFFVGMDES